MTDPSDLPVVVIGAGPIGLAAAAHLVERGIDPLVLEAGPRRQRACASGRHVRLFSPWAELVDPAAEKLLADRLGRADRTPAYPTGGDWAERYLQPLADVLGDRVRYRRHASPASPAPAATVVDAGRDEQPFTVHVAIRRRHRERLTARAVIDASGTWSIPSPLGARRPSRPRREGGRRPDPYRVPDLNDPAVRARYAGKRTGRLGSGASAFTALADLADLAQERGPGTRGLWILRRGAGGDTFGGGDADQLPARGALGLRAQAAVDDGHVTRGHRLPHAAVEQHGRRTAHAAAEDGRRSSTRSTRSSSSPASAPTCPSSAELRLGLDERLQAPSRSPR